METKISRLSMPLRISFRGDWGWEGMQGRLLSTPRPGIQGLPAIQQPSVFLLLLGVTPHLCLPRPRPPA